MVSLQDLPAVVEAYKTLDDANLVKVADIGQVRCAFLYWLRVVGGPASRRVSTSRQLQLQLRLESRDGITL